MTEDTSTRRSYQNLLQHYRDDVVPDRETLVQKASQVASSLRVLGELFALGAGRAAAADWAQASTDLEFAVRELTLLAERMQLRFDGFMDEICLRHIHATRQDAPAAADFRIEPGGDAPALFIDNPALPAGAAGGAGPAARNVRRVHVFTTPPD